MDLKLPPGKEYRCMVCGKTDAGDKTEHAKNCTRRLLSPVGGFNSNSSGTVLLHIEDGDHFLVVIANLETTLEKFEQFLQSIWYHELCGHLSSFYDCNDHEYCNARTHHSVVDVQLSDDDHDATSTRDATIGDAMKLMKNDNSLLLRYEYDFGSTSYAFISKMALFPDTLVDSNENEDDPKKFKVVLRNMMDVTCCSGKKKKCKQTKATYFCDQCCKILCNKIASHLFCYLET